MNIPKQYLPIMPYLIIPNARAFVTFMKTVYNSTEQLIVPRTKDLIMHGELTVGDGIIMFADVTEQITVRPAGMFVYIQSVDETYNKALAHGATSLTPPSKQEYGYTAGFQDTWGNQWWIVEP